jgi:hypothetical protein
MLSGHNPIASSLFRVANHEWAAFQHIKAQLAPLRCLPVQTVHGPFKETALLPVSFLIYIANNKNIYKISYNYFAKKITAHS